MQILVISVPCTQKGIASPKYILFTSHNPTIDGVLNKLFLVISPCSKFLCILKSINQSVSLYYRKWASLMAQSVKNLPPVQETQVLSLGREDLLEKEMATHSSILAWNIPWTEEPGGL